MNIRNLYTANHHRNQHTAQQRRDQAARAIQIIETRMSNDMRINDIQQRHLNILRARICYAEESFQQIAKITGVSKDSYKGRLERALEYADRLVAGGAA